MFNKGVKKEGMLSSVDVVSVWVVWTIAAKLKLIAGLTTPQI